MFTDTDPPATGKMRIHLDPDSKHWILLRQFLNLPVSTFSGSTSITPEHEHEHFLIKPTLAFTPSIISNFLSIIHNGIVGLGRDRPCDTKYNEKCPCSHINNTALIKQIFHDTTICPGSRDTFYIVSYYIKWVTISWTHGTLIIKYLSFN